MRDPGNYTLYVGISWFYGLQDPDTPTAERRKQFAPGMSNTANYVRSLVHGGMPIGVQLLLDANPALRKSQDIQGSGYASGHKKCTSGEHAGRWLAVDSSQPCKPPYCTGLLPLSGDDDAGSTKQWLWVPYDCYYHLYSAKDVKSCATSQNMTWLHAMGDAQQGVFMERLFSFRGVSPLEEPFESPFNAWKQVSLPLTLAPTSGNTRVQVAPTVRLSWFRVNNALNDRDMDSPKLRSNKRVFEIDRLFFDHFNMVPSEVCDDRVIFTTLLQEWVDIVM